MSNAASPIEVDQPMVDVAVPIEVDQPTVNVAVPIEVEQPVAGTVPPVEVAESAMETDVEPTEVDKLAGDNAAPQAKATDFQPTSGVKGLTQFVEELRDLLGFEDGHAKGNGSCTLSRFVLSKELRSCIPAREFFWFVYLALKVDEKLGEAIVTAHVDSSPLGGVYEPLSVGLLHQIISLMPKLESLTFDNVHLVGDDVPRPQRQPLQSRLTSLTINDNLVLHSRPELFAQLLHLFAEVDELKFENYGKIDGPLPRALFEDRPKDKNAVELKLAAKSLAVDFEPGAEGQDYVLKTLTRELDLAKLQELVVDGLHICAVAEMQDLLNKCAKLKRLQLAHSTNRPENAVFDLNEKPLVFRSLCHLEELVMDKIEIPLGVPIGDEAQDNMRYFNKLNATVASLPTGTLTKAVFNLDTTCGDQSRWTQGQASSAMSALPWRNLGATLKRHAGTLEAVEINIKYGHQFASEVDAAISNDMPELLRYSDTIRFSSVKETGEDQQEFLERALRELGLEDDADMEVASS